MLNQLNALKSVFISFSLFSLCSSVFAFDYGDPSSLEQAHLEAINRARANPLQEARRLNMNLFEGVPGGVLTDSAKQPLSFNAQLQITARNHSVEMLNGNYFAHTDLAKKSPFDRFINEHYDYLNASENIAMSGLTSAINDLELARTLHDELFLDHDYPKRGHRVTLLNPNYREVGIGLAFGNWQSDGNNFNTGMLVTDFGTRMVNRPIILGVVYDDTNHNNIYDAGEGIPNIKVAISQNRMTQTASAGGYGLEVDSNREYNLAFTHPNFGSIAKTVQISDLNSKVDVLISEFPNANQTSQRTSAPDPAQQCLKMVRNTLHIPCINAAGYVYEVDLEVLNNPPQGANTVPLQFGIHSIIPKNLSTATSCEVYDQHSKKAYLSCIQIDNHSYQAELTVKTSTAPVLELRTFDNLMYFM